MARITKSPASSPCSSPAGTPTGHVVTFSPLDLPEIWQWLNGQNVVTSGSNINTITDLSGNGNNMVASGTQATVGSAVLNGLDVIDTAHGTSAQYTNSNAYSPPTDGYTLYFVIRRDGATQGEFFRYNNTAKLQTRIGRLEWTRNQAGSGVSINDNSSSTLDNTQWMNFAVRVNSISSMDFYVDGLVSGTGNIDPDDDVTGSDFITLFTGDHQLAEMLIYNDAHTADQIAQLHGFLATKYGL